MRVRQFFGSVARMAKRERTQEQQSQAYADLQAREPIEWARQIKDAFKYPSQVYAYRDRSNASMKADLQGDLQDRRQRLERAQWRFEYPMFPTVQDKEAEMNQMEWMKNSIGDLEGRIGTLDDAIAVRNARSRLALRRHRLNQGLWDSALVGLEKKWGRGVTDAIRGYRNFDAKKHERGLQERREELELQRESKRRKQEFYFKLFKRPMPENPGDFG